MRQIKLILAILFLLAVSWLPAAATDATDLNLDHLLKEKKALIEENLVLTEQEKQVFWPLYDNYMKESVKIFKRRTALNKKLMNQQETINDEQARAIVDEHLDIVSESLKIKKSMIVKLLKKIPDKKVLKFLLVEEKIGAAYYYFLSENIPLIK